MGGLPCAKAVIDNGNALVQKLSCMNASIFLNAEYTQPTDEMMDEFIDRASHLAEYAAKIEKYVGEGRTTDGDYDRDKDVRR